MAAQRLVKHRLALALRRHGHRFALLHVLSAPRIFPPRALQLVMGREIERGELPGDEALVGAMIRNICFTNAKNYLQLELP